MRAAVGGEGGQKEGGCSFGGEDWGGGIVDVLWVRVECLSHCSRLQPCTLCGVHSVASADGLHTQSPQTMKFGGCYAPPTGEAATQGRQVLDDPGSYISSAQHV